VQRRYVIVTVATVAIIIILLLLLQFPLLVVDDGVQPLLCAGEPQLQLLRVSDERAFLLAGLRPSAASCRCCAGFRRSSKGSPASTFLCTVFVLHGEICRDR
jgi:hypothetical protein